MRPVKKLLFSLSFVLCLAAPALADKASDLDLMLRYFPQAVASVTPDGLVLSDGVRVVYDDGRAKDAETALDDTDIEDMLAQPYPLSRVTAEPAPGFHPGRRRGAFQGRLRA